MQPRGAPRAQPAVVWRASPGGRAASPGGPCGDAGIAADALNLVISQIAGVLERAPVLITQHMPPTFTAILAEHLERIAKRPVREARSSRRLEVFCSAPE